MTCQDLVELVTEYLEGVLPEDDHARLERHLSECPYCVEYVEQMRTTIGMLGSLEPGSLPPEVRERLLAAFAGWRDS